LLYGYGIHSAEVRSGGEPSRYGGFQRDAATGTVLPIRRSGGIEVETAGNYNSRGWLVELDDAQWWKATNLGDVPNDLYSIVHHEIGHALFFNPAHPRIDEAKRGNGLAAPDLRAYLGRNPRIDRADHFDGAIDPVCRRGAFGYEYHGQMPLGRWLITKLDLLAAQAAGYRLRDTAPFVPLAMSGAALPPANRAAWYSAMLRASGGVPFYNWEVIAGALPPGLSLDSFTGEMRGRPTQSGSYDFTVRVRDYDENAAGQTRRLRIVVADSAAPSPADPHHETAPLPHYRRHVPTTDGEHHEPG
jgi:hypothetical protein